MQSKHLLVVVMVGLCVMLAIGCGKSESETATAEAVGSGGAKISGVEKEAADYAIAEMKKRFLINGDGWTTVNKSGSSFAPIVVITQLKELSIESVDVLSLNEADKLNGFEWAGIIDFKKTPTREAGESGFVLDGANGSMIDRPKGRWSQWVDYSPPTLQVQKVKGQWQTARQYMWMLDTTPPTPEDFAKAGVK
jgi:hypothetical protein